MTNETESGDRALTLRLFARTAAALILCGAIGTALWLLWPLPAPQLAAAVTSSTEQRMDNEQKFRFLVGAAYLMIFVSASGGVMKRIDRAGGE